MKEQRRAATLTREVLDQSHCATPDCGHDHSVIYIHAQCHPRSELAVRYEKAEGECVIECGTCRREVTRLLVARNA